MPPQRTNLTDGQLSKLLHHIAVEVLALQQAGRDLNQVCLTRSASQDNWRFTRYATITLGDNGDAALAFNSEEAESLILRAIPKQDLRRREDRRINNRTATLPPASDLAQVLVGDLSQYPENSNSWMSMKLRDMGLKLAVSPK
jgi:hypothetical protein